MAAGTEGASKSNSEHMRWLQSGDADEAGSPGKDDGVGGDDRSEGHSQT